MTMRPRLAARADVRVEHGHERLPLIALVHDVEHVACVAPEPVETGDDQFITGPQKLDDGGQFGAALAAAAGHLLRADDAATLGLDFG
jgi:hypothetical protein